MRLLTVLAIDPGRAKCGIAVLDSGGVALYRVIVAARETPAIVNGLISKYEPCAVILGDGTGAAAARADLSASCPGISTETVDERHTSEMARKRYLAEHPPRGWRRLIPPGLRTPDQPYDDYVAILLAERWLANRSVAE